MTATTFPVPLCPGLGRWPGLVFTTASLGALPEIVEPDWVILLAPITSMYSGTGRRWTGAVAGVRGPGLAAGGRAGRGFGEALEVRWRSPARERVFLPPVRAPPLDVGRTRHAVSDREPTVLSSGQTRHCAILRG